MESSLLSMLSREEEAESSSSPAVAAVESASPCGGNCLYCGFDTHSTVSDVSHNSSSSTIQNNNNNNNNIVMTAAAAAAATVTATTMTTTMNGVINTGASSPATTTPAAAERDDDDDDDDEHLLERQQQEETTSSRSSSSNNKDDDDDVNNNNNNNNIAARWSETSIRRTANLWKLTDWEVRELRTLGENVSDVNHYKNAPEHVVRFYKARSNNLDAAEQMFRDMVDWRIKNHVDTILQDYRPPQQLLDYYPGAILQGLDKCGDPVYLSRIGSTDGSGLMRRFGHDEMLKQAIWIRENASKGSWINEHEQKYGRPVCQITIIEDVFGLGSSHLYPPLLSLYKEAMRIDQDYYPEMAKKMIIVRTPSVFRMIWNIAKHFFDPGVRSKMIFTGVHDFHHVLSQHIDLSILPSCVLPQIGQGMAAAGMPDRFEGGPLPPAAAAAPSPESSSSSQRVSSSPLSSSPPKKERKSQQRQRFPTAESNCTDMTTATSSSPCNKAKSLYIGDFPTITTTDTTCGASGNNNNNENDDLVRRSRISSSSKNRSANTSCKPKRKGWRLRMRRSKAAL